MRASVRQISGVAGAACILASICARSLASSGADVIVGDLLPDPYNGGYLFYKGPDPNGKYGYAVGTLSCNKGSVPLQWLTSSQTAPPGTGENRHPVIAQNMFVIDQGRFLHVTQAWLKHGFYAEEADACSFGCTPENLYGTYLGVGCSDPYSAGLNALQTGMGPKSEVNASTGVFPYPPMYQPPEPSPQFTDWERRMVIDPTAYSAQWNSLTAIWLVESQYVSNDDAMAKNPTNNASYRLLTKSEAMFSPLGPTYREKPGIYAWRDHGLGFNIPDPDVKIWAVDVPEDGRFYVGARVTQVNTNLWHYEYVVQNLNSNRSAQALRIRFPNGTVISDAGQHNVKYHSGEPSDNTPWTQVITSTQISWSGPIYDGTPLTQTGPTSWTLPTGNDATANALRWGTAYTFWFDANLPPGDAGHPGAMELSLFRPGSYGSAVEIAVPSPGGVTVNPPFNDSCVNAQPVQEGTWWYSTAGATSNGPQECAYAGSSQIDADVWLMFTAVRTAPVMVSTCGSDFDTKIAVYGPTCPTGDNLAIACNDDFDCDGDTDLDPTSKVFFNATSGQNYVIRVGSQGGTATYGNAQVTIASTGACCTTDSCTISIEADCAGTFLGLGTACTPTPCDRLYAPANDKCANAAWIADTDGAGAPITSTVHFADIDGPVGCSLPGTGYDTSSKDVWYKYLPQVSGPVRITTRIDDLPSGVGMTNFDTVLAVFDVCNGNILACNDDSGYGTTSDIPALDMTAGVLYYIRVAHYATAVTYPDTLFTLRVIGGQGVYPPANDSCSAGEEIAPGVYSISNATASTDGPAHLACLSDSQILLTNDLWYSYESNIAGELSVQVCATGGNFDPWIAVYNGAGCMNLDPRLLECVNNSTACGVSTNPSVTIPVLPFQTYTIRVGSYNNTRGTGTMTISFTQASGACCLGTSCSILSQSACSSSGGVYQGDGSLCEGTIGNPITCCKANHDKINGVKVADIFAFLSDWFREFQTCSSNCKADVNGNGVVNVSDIFAFLNAWFAGCP